MRTSYKLCATLAVLSFALPAFADSDAYIVLPNAQTKYRDSVTFVARLLDPTGAGCNAVPCPEPGGEIHFYVDGSYMGSSVTDLGGYAYLRLDALPEWHVGNHVLQAVYHRYVENVPPALATATLTIKAEVTKLTARDRYLEAELRDDEGNALVGYEVIFSVTIPEHGDEPICSAITDHTGTARCSSPSGFGVGRANSGEYNVDFFGTADYVPSRDQGNLL